MVRLFCIFIAIFTTVSASIKLSVQGKDTQLRKVDLQSKLTGPFLIREMELTFYNPNKGAAEGELIFPLNSNERVVAFAMDVEGIRREGVIVDAKRGRTAYETIVRGKKDPGLVEINEEKNEFRTRIFPIPGDGTKTVWLTTHQLIGEGEFTLWPQGFGKPWEWTTAFSYSEGEISTSSALTSSGKHEVIPPVRVLWKPDFSQSYWDKDSDGTFVLCEFSSKKGLPKHSSYPKNSRVELWLDGSSSIQRSALTILKSWLDSAQPREVALRILRTELSSPQIFSRGDDNWNDLLKRVKEEPSSGMASLSSLPWKNTNADLICFLTDGVFPEGTRTVQIPNVPLHVIDSGSKSSRWLASEARSSGGAWHDGSVTTPSGFTPMVDAQITSFQEYMMRTRRSKSRPSGRQTRSSYWEWAHRMHECLLLRKETPSRIAEFRREHHIASASSSWLVLETARQYAQYGFAPPKNDIRLNKEWQEIQKHSASEKRQALDQLAREWKVRCDALTLAEDSPTTAERIVHHLTKRYAFWCDFSESHQELHLAQFDPLFDTLKDAKELLEGGVTPEEGRALMRQLKIAHGLEDEFQKYIPSIQVTVGGQVRKPGRVMLHFPVTIMEAIQGAGGATPFGAVNRTKLFRRGKVYTYNLKNARHQQVKLESGDSIEVPQKNWLGNGGSKGRAKAPFARGNKLSVSTASVPWDSNKPYIMVLRSFLETGKDWKSLYRVQREVYGSRADFYLDCIDLLENHQMATDAIVVAQELARHMPDHPEVLRKAARALRRLGAFTLSHSLFRRIRDLEPENSVALFDFARSLVQQGHPAQAIPIFWEAAQLKQDLYSQGRSLIILAEMNAVLARFQISGLDYGIDSRMLKHIPIDLLISLEWDSDQANVDLRIKHPGGGWHTSSCPFVETWENSVSRGYGPETWMRQSPLPGSYQIGALFYGDWRDHGNSSTTAEIELIQDYGTKAEKRKRHAIRIDEKEDKIIINADADVVPEAWKN